MDFSKRTLNPFENKTCFLSLKSLSTEELKELIDRAVELSAMRAVKEQSATLKGRYVLLVTKNEYPNVKINFQIAVKELGGTPIVASVSGEALIIKENQPKVRGVIVIAQGAQDIGVRNGILSAVMTLLDVTADKVEILY